MVSLPFSVREWGKYARPQNCRGNKKAIAPGIWLVKTEASHNLAHHGLRNSDRQFFGKGNRIPRTERHWAGLKLL